VGLQFEEVLAGEKISFRPKLTQKGELPGIYGHRVLDAANRKDLEYLSALGSLNQD
jgi:hypothetical protein